MLTFRTLTTILSKVLLLVNMQKNHKVFSQFSSLNKRSTEDVLNQSLSCFVTAARAFFHYKINFYCLS